MKYQILVITSRNNNNVGGVGVSQAVVEFDARGDADVAFDKIELAAKSDSHHEIKPIKLY
ncbi:hypothetical protein YOLOSWAG_293 [Erwinia phage vB_EamM_Yoloswag]|uniref:Uncharacterized protein n=1 Tax=Erwinia phage vB_EamM_Yoloswag TaxID=1958956 RepID=A0A1S6L3K8_9CAUD|nr:hypothetical protein HOR66_gp293 [Erwinia phage vB_EamM_Yoloswag]AQT28763.1 hypothetical protein YOLOSWAG_293 [Erwinia phage vB_EamM_Yoloswag]